MEQRSDWIASKARFNGVCWCSREIRSSRVTYRRFVTSETFAFIGAVADNLDRLSGPASSNIQAAFALTSAPGFVGALFF